MSAMSATTRWATSSPAIAGRRATTCCIRWAGTRLACRPRMRRSPKGSTPPCGPGRTSRPCAASWNAWGLPMTGRARSPPAIPEYYRHEQKMFLDFLAAGLAYRRESWVNWDPVENTVLANEQVVDGRGWRSNAIVEKRLLAQWSLRITAFTEELLEAIRGLERWPERVRLMQENWIGRSEGARVYFEIAGGDERHRGLHDPAGHAVRRVVPGLVAEPPAGPAAGRKRCRARRLYRRMQPHGDERGGDRDRRETRLCDRPRSGAPVRPEPPGAGLGREFRADGIRHRRDLRLSGA